ncbi:cupin domain-containing protein [Aspergillus brunneoviolaceus CBS 621.78]|uniref:Uncharacterized protein n=1 Tax=Aspergillus brunneoviolaceus CBS 621.78 TaxID=1450534 RepID=A0ACD1GI38_9EURO|nr:hypothetical protein BO95DRAFT_489479 [Aspergillus brunneoviolaceus CBS 621.78]RAH48954.1 hypothetical protein BO95DRAFT_489479 [Aspergillus brunneoviolaceus CBS 621.78]
MPQIIPYSIPPTPLIPNSHKPLLLYKNCFLDPATGTVNAQLAYDTFRQNHWTPRWITTYGHAQRSHYHPHTHEAMVVLSGPGRIRWGTADLADDPAKHTYGVAGTDFEEGSVFVDVEAGDLFVIPAGVAHKSYDVATANEEPVAWTGSGAQRIEAADERAFVGELQATGKVKGFTMMGAYPGEATWSWAEGGEHVGRFEEVWGVENAVLDPVFGREGGIHVYWGKGKGKGKEKGVKAAL